MSSSNTSRLSAARIALGYALIATTWVAMSDLVAMHFRLPQVFLIAKGLAFVQVTALLLYLTIKSLVSTVEATSRERDETANLYRTVVEASGEGICLLDKRGRITFLNNRLATILRRSADVLKGKRLLDFVESEDLIAGTYNPQTDTATHECRLDGSTGWLLISTTPIAGSDGSRLAIVLDTTERKRLEEELRHSQKLEALGSLTGGIAHDFNNLLSIVTGYATLLDKTFSPDSPNRKSTRAILQASDRGAVLIRHLLAFSRKQNMITEVVDVDETIARFGEVLPRILGETIAVAVKCEKPTGSVRIGAGQIEQVLLNLAANARDAMPNGGTLTITTQAAEISTGSARFQAVTPGRYVSVEVVDTGTGIEPAVKARIFEPFFTTKGRGAGTGLGLSTVYGIAVQNGGFVTCDSTVGLGTAFTVYLPCTEDGAAKQDKETVETVPILTGTERVLLVEDDPILRALTNHILSSHGYVVVDAPNGAKALETVRGERSRFDLLLTDVVMPGMSGLELAEHVAQEFPGIRVAFMSGYADIPDQLGQAHVIQKPVAPDALLHELRTILGSKSDGHRAA